MMIAFNVIIAKIKNTKDPIAIPLAHSLIRKIKVSSELKNADFRNRKNGLFLNVL